MKKVHRLTRFMLPICLIFLSGCAALVGTMGPIPPKVDVTDIILMGVNGAHAEFEVKMDVNNPNGHEVVLNDLVYNLDIEGHRVADGHYNADVALVAHNTTKVTVPIKLNLMGSLSVLAQLAQKSKKLTAKWQAKAKIQSWLVSIPISFQGEKSLF